MKKHKNHIMAFLMSAFLGFSGGLLAYDIYLGIDEKDPKAEEIENASNQEAKESTALPTASAQDNILQKKGCLGCHAVNGLNLQGGATGPDLSQAFNNVEGKHGKPIDQFLKEPTSSVMSTVISGNPLSDEEINEVVDFLKQASEK